jgi:hypothetical protein
VDPCPASRCDVKPILCHLTSPHADEVEITGVGEPARRISGVRDGHGYRGNRELFGMFVITRRDVLYQAADRDDRTFLH